MQTTEILTIENEFKVEVPALVSAAEGFTVNTDIQYHEAVERANVCKTKLQRVLDFFKPMKEKTYAAWKEACAQENQFAPQLETAKKLYTQKAADYQLKKQREQEEKERKAREVADAAEAKKKADLEAKARAAEEEARKAREEGDAEAAAKAAEKAEALREKQENVQVAARPVAQAPRNASMSVQTVWEPQVYDESKVPVMYWKEVDLAKLKRMKKDNPKLEVPGIRFIEKAQGAAIGRK